MPSIVNPRTGEEISYESVGRIRHTGVSPVRCWVCCESASVEVMLNAKIRHIIYYYIQGLYLCVRDMVALLPHDALMPRGVKVPQNCSFFWLYRSRYTLRTYMALLP